MKSPRNRRPLLVRIFRGLLGGVAGLTILILLGYSVLLFWGHREWANARAELRAKGEKMSLAELIPPSIPADENFFAAPIWEEVMELESKLDEDGTQIWASPQKSQEWRIDAFRTALGNSKGGSILSKIGGSYEKGTRRNFDAAADWCRKENLAPAGLSSPQTILSALDAAKSELEEIESAAQRPRSNLVHPHVSDFGRMPVPYLTPALFIAQYLQMRVAAEAAEGMGKQAEAHQLLLLRLADTLKDDPLLITLLVRVCILGLAAQSVWDGLDAGCWSEAQLIAIEQRISEVDISKDYPNALRGERGGASLERYAKSGGMAQMGKDLKMLFAMEYFPDSEEVKKWLVPKIAWLYPRGLLFNSVAIYNLTIQQLIESVEADPFAPTLSPALEAQIAEFQHPPKSWLYPMPAKALVTFAGIQKKSR